MDDTGNVSVFGEFQGQITVKDANDNNNDITISSSTLYNNDAYIAKYSSSGNLDWATQISGDDIVEGNGISVDGLGNAYVIGKFQGQATVKDANDNNNDIIFTGTGTTYDAYIAKYSSSGNLDWATQISGASHIIGRGISVDDTGNVSVFGEFQGQITALDPNDSNNNLTLTSDGGDFGLFIIKLITKNNTAINSDGQLILNADGENVGVGTSHPAATLHVEGNVYVSSDINIKDVVTTQNVFGPVWAATATASGSSFYARKVAVDSDANVYVVGNIGRSSTLKLYNQGETSPSVTINIEDYNDLSDGYIFKYNTSGEVLWAATFGGNDNDYASAVAVDSDGNIYVVGGFRSSTLNVYNQGETSPSVTLSNSSLNYTSGILVKYNTSGEVLWATTIGGSSADWANAVAVDSDGNVYVAGQFKSSTLNVYSEGKTSPSVTLSNYSGYDAFIAKYSTSGEALLATKIGGHGTDSGSLIGVDSDGNVYVAGTFRDSTVNIYSEGETLPHTTLSNSGLSDGYIVKYNTSLEVLWATKIGGTDNDYITGFAVDSDRNVYVVGYFKSSTLNVYSEGGTSPSVTLSNSGLNDGYIVKYNTSGEVLWTTTLDGTGDDYSHAVAVDSDGNVYVAGRHQGMTLNSGDGSGITKTLSYFQQSDDSFVAKYSTSGRVLWAATITGHERQNVYGVAPDSDGNIYVVGNYENIATLYNEDQFDTIKILPGEGIFIAKYGNISKVDVISPNTAFNVNGDIKISGEITGPGRRMFKTYRGTLTTHIYPNAGKKYVRTGVFLGEGFYTYRASIVGRDDVNANRTFIRRGIIATESIGTSTSSYYQDVQNLGFVQSPTGQMRLDVFVEEYSSILGEFVFFDDPSVDTPAGTYDWEISIDEYHPFY